MYGSGNLVGISSPVFRPGLPGFEVLVPALATDDNIHDFRHVEIGKHNGSPFLIRFDRLLQKINLLQSIQAFLLAAVLVLAVFEAANHMLDSLIKYTP